MISSVLIRLASKKSKILINFTPAEKKKLEKVYLNDDFAHFFKWKRYPINEQVVFKGEAEIINWENRLIATGGLTKARELASIEKLDLVLVRKDPPVVRVMNYKNFILRWAFKDIGFSTAKEVKKGHSIVKVNYWISSIDLDYKIRKIPELMKETNLIIFETDPFDPLDEDEVKLVKIFEKELHEKIKQFVENKQMVINLISTPNMIRVQVRSIGKQKESVEYTDSNLKDYSDSALYNPFETFQVPDEDEFMKSILNSSVAPKMPNKKEEMFSLPEKVPEMFFKNKTEEIKYKIKSLLGDDLASKFLKGRLKKNKNYLDGSYFE